MIVAIVVELVLGQQLNNRNKKVASDWSKKKKNRTAKKFLTLIVCLTMMLCCSFHHVMTPNRYFSSTRIESNVQWTTGNNDIPIDDKDIVSSGRGIVARRTKETSSATNATKEAPGLAACVLMKDENHNS